MEFRSQETNSACKVITKALVFVTTNLTRHDLCIACVISSALVPEAFFYSLLANFETRTASFISFLLVRSTLGSALRSALRVANFQIKNKTLKESLWDQGSYLLASVQTGLSSSPSSVTV